MNILRRLFWRTPQSKEHTNQATQARFLPDSGLIYDWHSSVLLEAISSQWEEAKRQLYDGSFASLLKKGKRNDWAAHATAVTASQPDKDVGLFCFAIRVSLSADKYVNTYKMLDVAMAAIKAVPPTPENAGRIRQMLEQVPRWVKVYREDDDRCGFFYDKENDAHAYLQSIMEALSDR